MKLDIRTLSASLVAGFVSWYLCAGIYNKNADFMWTPLLVALFFSCAGGDNLPGGAPYNGAAHEIYAIQGHRPDHDHAGCGPGGADGAGRSV